MKVKKCLDINKKIAVKMISHSNRELKILLCKNFIYLIKFNNLFLSEVNVNRHTGKIIDLTQLIFNKTFVRIFYILG